MTDRPAYPGDSIRQHLFRRGDESGDVRIMDYGDDSRQRYRVAVFCPGYETAYDGDTPKMNPELDHWCNTREEADKMFDVYLDWVRGYKWRDA